MGCIFCSILRGEIPAKKVYEDEHVVAFHDIQPQAPTHILVIPREHKEKLSDYGDEDTLALGRLMAATAKIAREQGLADYRTIINCGKDAGQAVFHLHVHLLAGRPFGWPPG